MALMTETPSIRVIATPDFQTQLRKLAKRYRKLRQDLQPLLDDLETGNCPGDQIPGTDYTVFKALIQADQTRKNRLEALAIEGINSGASTPMIQTDWDNIRAAVRQNLSRKQSYA
jgi:mRNA-degrading endonuclease RelE of RelBE toxin-antitoxin system